MPNIQKGLKEIRKYTCFDWNKKKELRDEYFEWISMFEENAEGPIFAAVY